MNKVDQKTPNRPPGPPKFPNHLNRPPQPRFNPRVKPARLPFTRRSI